MVTPDELVRVLLAPVLVAAVIAGIGGWRRWGWAMPLAAGAGFITGYALLGVPKLPPRDGTDWLFWMAIPATLLGILDATLGRRWGWALGLSAGAMAVVVGLPLAPHAVSHASLFGTAALLAVGGVAVCLAAQVAEPRVTSPAAVAALCVTLGGAAVVVMSSNLRIVGVYGIAAAAAFGPVAVLTGRVKAGRVNAGRVKAGQVNAGRDNPGRSVALVAVALLGGLLAGGRFYPDPGVTWTNLVVLLFAPVLLLTGAFIPGKRDWVRGVVAVLAVAVAVGVVTAPTALAAKKASEEAETDPYSAYYQ